MEHEASIKPELADAAHGLEAAVPAEKSSASDERPRYKSYRKKYRKMKLSFDKLMEEANELFLSERRATEIAQRIQEQNDKILDVLLEINSSKHTPAGHRFDLALTTAKVSSPSESPREDQQDIAPPGKSLQSLQDTAAYTPFELASQYVLATDLQTATVGWPGFFAAEDDDAELSNLDERASDDDEAVQDHDRKPVETRPAKPSLTERDFAVQNPVSVHNWLRKHQPQVFDSKDKESDKGAKSPPPSRKKKSAKPEPAENLDEEGEADSAILANSKMKRKRDDETYRPKGGHSRPSKRKREKEEGDAKRGKKSRKSNGIEDES